MVLRTRKVSGAIEKRDPGYGRVEYTGCAPFSYSASISQSPLYNLYRIQKECNLPEASWARYSVELPVGQGDSVVRLPHV